MDSISELSIFLFVAAILYISSSHGAKIIAHTSRINLNKHGYVTDETPLPTCNNGGRIKLLSYKYLYCPHGNACTSLEERLSPAAEVTIHEMCSLKHTCIKSKFLVADLKMLDRTMIEITYQCLDQFETFIDMCLNTTKRDDKTVHLIYKENAAAFETCQCAITGVFTLSLSDVRLKSAYSDQCSPAKLNVHSETYICDATKDDYRSVFGKTIGRELTEELVVFTTDYTSVEPEMIYLTIKPKESIRLWCESKPRYRATAVKVETENQICPTQNDVSSTGSTSTLLAVMMVGAGSCVTLVGVCIVLGVSRCKNRAVQSRALVNIATGDVSFTEKESGCMALLPNQGAAAKANIKDAAILDQIAESTDKPCEDLNEQKLKLPSFFHKLLHRKDTEVNAAARLRPLIGNKDEKTTSRIKLYQTQEGERFTNRHCEQPDLQSRALVDTATGGVSVTEKGSGCMALLHNQGAPAKDNIEDAAHLDQTAEPTDKHLENLNEQMSKLPSFLHKLLHRKDTEVNVDARLRLLIGDTASPEMSTSHKTEDQMKLTRKEVSHTDARMRSGDKDRFREKNVTIQAPYIDNETCHTPAHLTDQKEMKAPYDDKTNKKESKKNTSFKQSKAKKNTPVTLPEFVTDPSQNRGNTIPVLTNENKAVATTKHSDIQEVKYNQYTENTQKAQGNKPALQERHECHNTTAGVRSDDDFSGKRTDEEKLKLTQMDYDKSPKQPNSVLQYLKSKVKSKH